MKNYIKTNVRTLSAEEGASVEARFERLVYERPAPVRKYPNQVVWWPKCPAVRVLPEGILARGADEGFPDHDNLTRFFNRLGDGAGVYVGDLNSLPPHFKHMGKYGRELCEWIKTSLHSSPTCLISTNLDLVLIADEQLRYTVIGGSSESISLLETEWGGAASLRKAFTEYVERGDLGFDDDDLQWARKYLMRWSGWVEFPGLC